MTARPEELRMLLLEGALKFANQGRQGLESRDFEQSFSGLSQCRAIVVELMSNMRDEVAPEICGNVRALYTFIFNQLTEASLDKDLSKLSKAIELLEYERETWALLMEELAAERAAGRDPVAAASAGLSGAAASDTVPLATNGADAAAGERPSISVSA